MYVLTKKEGVTPVVFLIAALNGKAGYIDHPLPVCSEQSVFIGIIKSLFADIETLTFRFWVLRYFRNQWSHNSGEWCSLAPDFSNRKVKSPPTLIPKSWHQTGTNEKTTYKGPCEVESDSVEKNRAVFIALALHNHSVSVGPPGLTDCFFCTISRNEKSLRKMHRQKFPAPFFPP